MRLSYRIYWKLSYHTKGTRVLFHETKILKNWLSFRFISFRELSYHFHIFIYQKNMSKYLFSRLTISVLNCFLYFLKSFVSDVKLSFRFVLQNTIKLLYPKFFLNERRNIFCIINFRINFDTKVSCLVDSRYSHTVVPLLPAKISAGMRNRGVSYRPKWPL